VKCCKSGCKVKITCAYETMKALMWYRYTQTHLHTSLFPRKDFRALTENDSQNQQSSRRCLREKNLKFLPGIERRFLCHPGQYVLTALTELSRFHKVVIRVISMVVSVINFVFISTTYT
jgi:hypothetical protein